MASRRRREPNVVPIDATEDELLDALKSIGEDILKEPTPEHLPDGLRKKMR